MLVHGDGKCLGGLISPNNTLVKVHALELQDTHKAPKSGTKSNKNELLESKAGARTGMLTKFSVFRAK